MITNIVDVLMQLQKQGLAHSNIKPQNILLSDDGFIKLSDYTDDLAQRKKVNMLNTFPAYFAPEKQALLLKMQNYKVEDETKYYIQLCKCDVFSLGLTMLNAASLEVNQNVQTDQSLITEKLQQLQNFYSDEVIFLI